ncbi:hypothetical protein [Bacillus cihuensis]|uniref:hypothetical protein n=1 Tax=Bacillus cihuensis TaxID=1208599 RepID=UPI000409BE3F|nr:hypothetical protein [Bacillus cihuensis]
MVVMQWQLWNIKEAIEYIREMKKIGLNCRLCNISDLDWTILKMMFGSSVERVGE